MASDMSFKSNNAALIVAGSHQLPKLWEALPPELRNLVYRSLLDDIVSISKGSKDEWGEALRRVIYKCGPFRALLLANRAIYKELKSIFEAEYHPQLHYRIDDVKLLRTHLKKFSDTNIPANINPMLTIRTKPRLVGSDSEHRRIPAMEELIHLFSDKADASITIARKKHFAQHPPLPTSMTAQDGSKFEAIEVAEATEEWPREGRFLRILTSTPETGHQRIRYVLDLKSRGRSLLDTMTGPLEDFRCTTCQWEWYRHAGVVGGTGYIDQIMESSIDGMRQEY